MEKVFGSCPGESASKEPPRMPHVENVETRGNFSTTGLLLNRSHLLVAAVPADKYLDRVLGNCRGGSGGLCLTHLWKEIIVRFSILTSHIHIVWQPQICVCRVFSRAEPVIARRWQEDGRTLESVLRSRGIGWKRGKPRRALRPGLSWDSTSRLLRLTLTLLSQLLLLIIGYAETNKFTNILRCSTTKQIATALRQNTILSANFYQIKPQKIVNDNFEAVFWKISLTSPWQFE